LSHLELVNVKLIFSFYINKRKTSQSTTFSSNGGEVKQENDEDNTNKNKSQFGLYNAINPLANNNFSHQLYTAALALQLQQQQQQQQQQSSNHFLLNQKQQEMFSLDSNKNSSNDHQLKYKQMFINNKHANVTDSNGLPPHLAMLLIDKLQQQLLEAAAVSNNVKSNEEQTNENEDDENEENENVIMNQNQASNDDETNE
jgi:hypothetical protein